MQGRPGVTRDPGSADGVIDFPAIAHPLERGKIFKSWYRIRIYLSKAGAAKSNTNPPTKLINGAGSLVPHQVALIIDRSRGTSALL